LDLFSKSCRFEIIQNHAFFNQKESNRNKTEKENKKIKEKGKKGSGATNRTRPENGPQPS
jgi:hypothetical protein